MPILDFAAVETALIEKANTLRSASHLEVLSQNISLTTAARSYAAYLADKDLFSHTADGWSPEERVNIEGYKWCRLSENLSLRQKSQGISATELAADVLEGWMKSPQHRSNLLEPHVTETGVGVAGTSDAQGKFISVQLFARPQTLQYEISIKNTTNSPIPYTLGKKEKKAPARMTVRHSLCDPQNLTFNFPKEKKIAAEYKAKDNTEFILSQDKDQNLKVEITHPR